MKKLLLFLAVVGIAFFASCEKPEIPCEYGEEPEDEKITSLEGTSWIGESLIRGDDKLPVESNAKYELTFTLTSVTYVYTYGESYSSTKTGSYSYDPPMITIDEGKPFFPTNLHGPGIVEGDTLTVGVFVTDDMVETIELKKQ
jgi:hypothetical protein